MDSVENKSHLQALSQHLAGRLAIPASSTAAQVDVLMGSSSGITAMSEKPVEALRGQPGMAQTALTRRLLDVCVW